MRPGKASAYLLTGPFYLYKRTNKDADEFDGAKGCGDLLFSAPLQTHETARLFTLLEHQSTADPAMPLRGLRYQLRIWERDHKEQPAPWLPPIFVVVISHADGRWAAPRSLDDMLDPRVLALPGAAELVPRFSLIIEDLAQRSDDELQAQSLAAFPKLALWLLRDGSKPVEALS